MDWLAQLDVQRFVLFTLVLARVSGVVMTVPVFGTPDVPAQVRALLGVALAVLVMPSQWDAPVADPGTLLNYLVFVGSELVIGLSLGLGVAAVFSGIEVAGQMIAQASGLAIAEIFDPAQETNVSVFSRLLFLVTLAIFLSIGGHRMVMAGLLDTFQAMPPGSAAVPRSLVETLATLVAASFSLGIRAAAPLVVSLLLANLVLGLIGRTLPQLNILVVGFGINSLLTLGVLAAALGGAAWVFQPEIEPAVAAILEGLRTSAIP